MQKKSVHVHTDQRLGARLAWVGLAFYFLAGQAMIPHLGVQNDEALFVTPLYDWRQALYTLRIGHAHFPLMLMSYLGTLKIWIYRPIFRIFGASVWTLREPMLLAGAAGIWLFFLLLRRIVSERAAVIGCGLLAADSVYLLTCCFDWGPVAMQHVLLLGASLLAAKFWRERTYAALAGAAFLAGLAMWDKALAVWILSSAGVAALILFARQIWSLFTWRRAIVAAAAFGLGALPLLIYNAANHWDTFHGNFKPETKSELRQKVTVLKLSLFGDGLFGYMTSEDRETPKPHPPGDWLESASTALAGFSGRPRHDLLPYALALALLLTPLARGMARKWILFAAITMALAWIQMAFTAGAGGSIHHVVLLWPLPQMIVAISFAAASERLGRAGIPTFAVISAAMILAGCLVINNYYAVMVRNGGEQAWTDAIFPLADYLKRAPTNSVNCVDWGILDSLSLLGSGKLPLRVASDPNDRASLEQLISNPRGIFVAHTKQFEFFTGVNEKVIRFGEDSGYRRELLTVISDGYGRPTFEVYRFVVEISATASFGRGSDRSIFTLAYARGSDRAWVH